MTNEKMKMPKWRWLLLPLSPVVIPVAFGISFVLALKRHCENQVDEHLPRTHYKRRNDNVNFH